MGANSPISNWIESLEQDVLLPVHGSNPAVGVVGKENIVLAVEKTVTDPRSTTNILHLDNTGITLAYAGCGRDAPFLVKRVQVVIKYCEHLPIRPEYVARYVAGVPRQFDCCGRKPYSLLTLIVGFEPSTLSHELWVAHPSGIVRKCRAHAIGKDFELRNEFLGNNYNYQETSGHTAVKLAIRALLEVGESGEKKIEVTLVTREHGLKPLEQAEIDAIIAEIEAEASEKAALKKKKRALKKKTRKAKKVAAEAADLAEMEAEHVEMAIVEGPEVDEIKAENAKKATAETADLAEMEAEHVEMAHVEGPEVDEIKAENATHSWISKILSCLLVTAGIKFDESW